MRNNLSVQPGELQYIHTIEHEMATEQETMYLLSQRDRQGTLLNKTLCDPVKNVYNISFQYTCFLKVWKVIHKDVNSTHLWLTL